MNKEFLLGLIFVLNCCNAILSVDKSAGVDPKRAELLERLHNVSKAKKLARTKNKGFVHGVCHESAAKEPYKEADLIHTARPDNIHAAPSKALHGFLSSIEKTAPLIEALKK